MPGSRHDDHITERADQARREKEQKPALVGDRLAETLIAGVEERRKKVEAAKAALAFAEAEYAKGVACLAGILAAAPTSALKGTNGP